MVSGKTRPKSGGGALARLRGLREKQGWSQTELAQISGISQASISAYERGFRGAKLIPIKHIFRLARALRVHPTAIDPRAGEDMPTEILHVVAFWSELDRKDRDAMIELAKEISRRHGLSG